MSDPTPRWLGRKEAAEFLAVLPETMEKYAVRADQEAGSPRRCPREKQPNGRGGEVWMYDSTKLFDWYVLFSATEAGYEKRSGDPRDETFTFAMTKNHRRTIKQLCHILRCSQDDALPLVLDCDGNSLGNFVMSRRGGVPPEFAWLGAKGWEAVSKRAAFQNTTPEKIILQTIAEHAGWLRPYILHYAMR